MKFQGTLKKVHEVRTGTSKKTGEVWHYTPVEVEVKEQSDHTLSETTHTILMDVKGQLDIAACNYAIASRTVFAFTVFFGTSEWNGRTYHDIHGYLPAEMMLKPVQAQQSVTPQAY